MDTIFAVSSGRPPAAIAVLRVSGPDAAAAGKALTGRLPAPRRAAVRALRDPVHGLLDRALVLWFPGPATATGEDLLELHLHGGRAVIEAVERALAALPGLRHAEPGAFTRRALANGRIDLAQAEGLADLLEAETERQRRAAIASAEGVLSRRIRGWIERLATIAAQIEAAIDFDDEPDVPAIDSRAIDSATALLAREIATMLAQPTTDRLRSGVRIVLSGRPNAGKSSLFNALVDRDAAIVSPIAGTTRDCVEASVRRDGILYTLVDTAGLRADSDDPIEQMGIDRSYRARDTADVVLVLDDDAVVASPQTIHVWSRGDGPRRGGAPPGAIATSIQIPETIDRLWAEIATRAARLMDCGDDILLTARQQAVLGGVARSLGEAGDADDPLLKAEAVRVALRDLAGLLGIDATEAMLDALFGRFCIGK